MSRDWEPTFRSWGAPPSETEQTKCENAERAIRKALDASSKLSLKPIRVFTQGSYANRTNVRRDSDVDICVLYTGAFFGDYAMSQSLSRDVLGFTRGGYSYADFKNDVEAALVDHFGKGAVTRGNKAFDVHANTYRVDADVVPCFQHRRYMGTAENHWYHEGAQLNPDTGNPIINWPKHNYDNGVAKNEKTERRFKALVRIFKRLRNEITDHDHKAAEPIPSFLIECLVWNVPNNYFQYDSYFDAVRNAVAWLWNETRGDASCSEWGEVNELKYLFRPAQPWTREQANDFLQTAWDYVGFK